MKQVAVAGVVALLAVAAFARPVPSAALMERLGAAEDVVGASDDPAGADCRAYRNLGPLYATNGQYECHPLRTGFICRLLVVEEREVFWRMSGRKIWKKGGVREG